MTADVAQLQKNREYAIILESVINDSISKVAITESSKKLINFIISELNIFSLFNHDGLSKLTRIVFGLDANADIILNLTKKIIAELGVDYDQITDLVFNSVCIDSSGDMCIVPSSITEMNLTANDTMQYLKQNKWIVTICLVNMYGNLLKISTSTAAKKESA